MCEGGRHQHKSTILIEPSVHTHVGLIVIELENLAVLVPACRALKSLSLSLPTICLLATSRVWVEEK